MRLKDFVERLGAIRVEGPISRDVAGITSDSRQVTPGMLYVAVPQRGTDLHRSMNAAVDRGAVAIVSDGETLPAGKRPRAAAIQVRDARTAFARAASIWHSDPSARLQIIGVTGEGAGETALMLKRLLCLFKVKSGLISATRHEVGERFFPVRHAADDALEIQRLLAQMARLDCGACVIELGQDPLAQAQNLGLSLSRLVCCGAKAPEELISRAIGSGVEVAAPYSPSASLHYRSHGIGQGDVRAQKLRCSREGAEFELVDGPRAAECAMGCLGYERVRQFLAAVAALDFAAGSLADVARYARSVSVIQGRMQRVVEGDGFNVFVDHAAAPAELSRVLNAARPFAHERLIVVAGATGGDSLETRRSIGRTLAQVADVTILTSNDPGAEAPEVIIEQAAMEHQAASGRELIRESDRARAIETAIRTARKGDMIVITGKGERTTQKISGAIIPFDDAEVARGIVQYQQLALGLGLQARDAGRAPQTRAPELAPA